MSVPTAKFHQNLLEIATVRARTDRHRQSDRGDLIICPMLCYSNGTDKNLWCTNCYVLGILGNR